MSFFKNLFVEKCPTCQVPLISQSTAFPSQIVKSCPNGHYEKEKHPAFDIWVETEKKE
ncbi:hypothetical protein QR721_10395 [Aciduricibacillus chroicocephali]|uniref:Uncharacterized protein n=1 Tax=Aciduricibacillus chroicocephali TaxID=3054939 RepID=A0ABY9KTE9_9BACI|nr:hypothetical protein QR721_10395 [Bacillaceae bacterium 44XB]